MADSTDLTTNSLSAAAETAIDTFYSMIGEVMRGWERIFTIKTDQREITNYKPVDFSGISDFTAQNANGQVPDADDITVGGSSYTAPAYEKRVTVTEYALAKTPDYATAVAQEFANAAANTISKLAFALLAAADTTAHPDDTNYTAVGGGTSYLADNHATPQAQANLITTAFGVDGLKEAHAILRGYLNKSGVPMDYASDPLIAVVSTTDEQAARNLLAQNSRTYDGSGLADVTGALFQDYIVNPYTSDANDWLLISQTRNPFGMWIPRAPYLRIDLKPGASRFEMYSGYECGTFLKPFEGGFVMASV